MKLTTKELKAYTCWSDGYIWTLAKQWALTVEKSVNANGHTINLYDPAQVDAVMALHKQHITLTGFSKLSGVSRTCLRKLMSNPEFPKSVKTGFFINSNPRRIYFKRAEVEQFLKQTHPYKLARGKPCKHNPY